MYQYHKDGTLPEGDEIFVFSSNLAGIHGAGAAKVARDKFGAKPTYGYGLFGRSFAIPTKDVNIRTMGKDDIEEFILMFRDFVENNPDKKFFITRVGCGLAGYSDWDIAPMFKNSPCNCNFPYEWKEYLE